MILARQRSTMLVAIAALVALDLASKLWATGTLADAPIALPGPLDLRLSYNSGTAFGLFSKIPGLLIAAVTAAIAIALLRAWWLDRTPTGPTALIGAGAVANTIDRIEAGSVVDMLHTGWWPTFNLADVFITIGVAWWALLSITADHPTPTHAKQHDTPEPSQT